MLRPVHRDEARRFAYGVGTLGLLAVVAIIGGIAQTGGALPGKSYTYVTADFKDVGVLKPGKQVKQNGLRIGNVSAVEYHDGVARITLRLDGDHDVYRNAEVAMANSNALGKKYVTIDPGTPDAGALGDDVVPVSQTTDSSSLEDVFQVMDPATRKATRAAIAELSTGLAGHGNDLNALAKSSPDLLADLGTVARALSSSDADLDGLLVAADRLAGRFEGRQDELARLVATADESLTALSVDGGKPLRESVEDLPATLRDAKTALDSLNQPLGDARVALTELEPGGRALGKSAADLRAFLRDAVGPLAKVPGVSESAEPALAELVDPLSDARPMVPRLVRALDDADQLLFGLAPYAADAGMFFSHHDLLSGTVGPGKHYFAAMLTSVGLSTWNGLPDPLAVNEPYPDPGTSLDDSTVTGGDR